jgi:hypothetical protein
MEERPFEIIAKANPGETGMPNICNGSSIRIINQIFGHGIGIPKIVGEARVSKGNKVFISVGCGSSSPAIYAAAAAHGTMSRETQEMLTFV